MAHFEALLRSRPASRLACVPALAVLAVSLSPSFATGRLEPESRMAAESAALLAVCLIQTVRPTLLGWGIPLAWFSLCTAETIWLGLRPGFGSRAPLAIALVLIPAVFLIGFRPRTNASERGALSFAVLAGLVVVAPLFIV